MEFEKVLNEFRGKPGTGTKFKNAVKEFKKEGVKDPAALAATIGRKKYGKEKFQKMAAKGKK